MPSECVAAIDIGTQTTRAALVEPNGSILDLEGSSIELHAPRPGWAEQDPEQWWATTLRNLAAVRGRHPEVHVAAIGVGAQMHSLVAVDAAARPLDDWAALWSDKRCLAEVDAFLRREDAGELSILAGNRPLPAWPGFKMAWLAAHEPALYEKADKLLVAKDYLNFRLCGVAATDPTEASGTFLSAADDEGGAWCGHLLEALGIDEAKLAPIAPSSSSVIGTLVEEVGRATGLASGTPVVAGAGDMLCQLLAAGLTVAGRAALVTGTASIMASAQESAGEDSRTMNLRSASGGWVRFGISDAAGESFRWLADELCPAGGASLSERFSGLIREASEVPPGSGGLLFFPYLLGERTLGSARSRASFVGATIGHRRAHFVRAVLEGITFEDRRAFDLLCPSGTPEPIRCGGGGAASAFWNQLRADVFCHPVETLATSEGGIVGAALLAGVGAGWYPDAASAADAVVLAAERFSPLPAATAAYDAGYRRFCAVHDALDGLWPSFDQGGTE